MKLVVTLFTLLALATGSFGQASARPSKKKPAKAAVTADDLKQLRDSIAAQQQQIQQLQQQIQQRDQSLDQLVQKLTAAQNTASDAQAKASEAAASSAKVPALESDVKDLKLNATNTAASLQDEQKRVTEMVESPVAIHYKGITITPGGFLAAETVWRAHGMASDVATPFNSVPFKGADAGHLAEFFGSGRPSRITLLLQGKAPKAALTGYFEMDWLSAGVTSNNNQSGSYTNRMRQLWAQATLDSGWSFTGGQMWSLVTETKNGMDNRTEAVPSVIDHAYNVGFSWARQYGFRMVKNFNNKMWLGFAIENAQTTLAQHNAASNFTFGSAGTPGGAYNNQANYSFNVSPDYIFKAVWQPKYGHYELFGVLSPMRDRVYPNATATPASVSGAFNDTRIGGGVGANARWLVHNKHIELGLHAMGGDGTGRYSASSLPDATVRPDGTLALLHEYSGLGTVEFHYPKFDVYFNGGTEYVSRWSLVKPGTAVIAANTVGYGSPLYNNSGCQTEALPGAGGFGSSGPGNCNNDTKNLFEFSTGFYIKFYNGPKGRVQWGPQYSFIRRNLWTGTGGAPSADQHMLLTSFRYYLP